MISAGAILVENGTLLPKALRLDKESHASGWGPVADNLNRGQLEDKLNTAGWTFFFMAGEIRTTVFGFDRANMLDAALRRLLADVKLQKCNCLEIDEVTTRSFLGMPYLSMSGHSRHIQKGQVFSNQ